MKMSSWTTNGERPCKFWTAFLSNDFIVIAHYFSTFRSFGVLRIIPIVFLDVVTGCESPILSCCLLFIITINLAKRHLSMQTHELATEQ